MQMPVAVDPQYNLEEPVLGVTLSNVWTDGNIAQVDEFVVMVPDDFKLINCDRWYPDTERAPFESKDGYDSYRFSREEMGDVRQTFQSVTCWLHIKEPIKLLSGAEKVQRTFAAQAKYRYMLEKPISITVQK
jgi:hypothetical protein